MGCPFETPVKVIETNGTIVDVEDVMVLKALFHYPDKFELQMQQLHYATKAINCYEKFKKIAEYIIEHGADTELFDRAMAVLKEATIGD